MRKKDNKKPRDRFHEIETSMREAQLLFTAILGQMEKSSKGMMGMPINISQLKALSAFDEDKPYSMGDLCQLAQVKMPSMTEVVDRLVAEGFVERVRDTEDRRVVKVQLTERGKNAHGSILQTREQELLNIFGCLDEKERTRLLKSLRAVSTLMKRVADRHKE